MYRDVNKVSMNILELQDLPGAIPGALGALGASFSPAVGAAKADKVTKERIANEDFMLKLI